MVGGGITDGDHRRRHVDDVAVAMMAITTMNENAASVEAGGVDREAGAQNGGSSMLDGVLGWIMLWAERSS
jgi:hypothetical protein